MTAKLTAKRAKIIGNGNISRQIQKTKHRRVAQQGAQQMRSKPLNLCCKMLHIYRKLISICSVTSWWSNALAVNHLRLQVLLCYHCIKEDIK
jgi:ribosomal protein L35